MRHRPTSLSALLLLAACAGTERRDLYRPGDPTPAQLDRLRAAERAYREHRPEYAPLRDELARDPVTACWLTRMFVRDVMEVRQARDPGSDTQLLRSAAGYEDPAETRALAEIDALGAAAVPCLVEDLAKHRQTYVRQFGVELLGRLGAVALPGLQPLVASDSAVERRTAAQALAAMPPSRETFARSRQLAQDPDFTVRAAAMAGLPHGGPEGAALLRSALANDADPFVRRAAAQGLASCPESATATALIDYLERCKRERDPRGEEAAQEALQGLARARGPRSVDAWRAWARGYDPADRNAAPLPTGNKDG